MPIRANRRTGGKPRSRSRGSQDLLLVRHSLSSLDRPIIEALNHDHSAGLAARRSTAFRLPSRQGRIDTGVGVPSDARDTCQRYHSGKSVARNRTAGP